MLTSETLTPVVATSLGIVLRHLGEGEVDVPVELAEQLKAYGRFKAEHGRPAAATALGLGEGEFAGFDTAVRDVERTLGKAVQAGDAPAERNLVIAEVRLLSWLETLGQRMPALGVDADVEALTSEDVGRKQVRALELIVRSLVNESHGDQAALASHLKTAVGDDVVAKWQQNADPDDLLSGCTFSELATLFASKSEFDRYQAIYRDTPFLTLLKKRQKTTVSFLEDVRRIRNALAHHKRISNLQLTLLDLYYEELVTPVQEAFDEGETKVDPGVYLDATPADLEAYFSDLQEDVRSVKDDLADLRAEVLASLGKVEADTAEIKETTKGLNRKVLAIGGGVLVLIVAAVLIFSQGKETREDVEAARLASERTEEVARDAADTTTEAAERIEEAAESSEAATETVTEAAESLEDAADATQASAERTEEAAGTTQEAAEATQEAAEATQEAAEEMTEATEKVVQTLEEIRQGFAALTQTGGIIQEPKRPQEHYHNARLYEQRGDAAKAMASYRAFFAIEGPEFVDPHLRYQALLKLQNGLSGAREVYYEMKQAAPESLVTELAWLMLLDDEARLEGLEAFVAAHADFAPGLYALSREYSVARLGSQSMADKRQEKGLLKRFLKVQEDGDYLRWYLDQTVAAKQIEDAKQRFAALETLSDEVLETPVSLVAMNTNQGWMLTFSIPDTVKEIFYRVGTEGAFKSTGFVDGVLSHAGLPLPNPQIGLPIEAPRTVIFVKYKDPRDREHGPYELVFDPAVQVVADAKRALAHTTQSWILFRDWNNELNVYFSSLVGYRVALRELRYGVDVETPDRTYPLPPVDPKKPLETPSDHLPFIKVPKSTRFVTVLLIYKDGTTSEVVRFDR